MHWAYKVAEDLINKYPEKETFVCASGISPSGPVHIGNFREVVTTYFVVKALQKMNKKTRFIFSWDNYDRFRKVPKTIDQSYEAFIGMPYSEVPDPYGCHQSYAEHFQKEFEKALNVFGIDVEFIYQSEEYKSGRYNNKILHALNKRKEIYDILMEFKTQSSSNEERDNFYPITLYCPSCKKDDPIITNFNSFDETISYQCKCGYLNNQAVLVADNIKLNWKIDWPMRWMEEKVVFEPGGRDHSSETGSYNVSKVIADKIFNYSAPEYMAYDFIGIKGRNDKMSSSSGNTITPQELLKIYLPEVILFLFSKYRPDASFNIGLDEDVIRNYSEFERYQLAFVNGALDDEGLISSLELSQIRNDRDLLPKFSQLAGILPLINFKQKTLLNILHKNKEEYPPLNVTLVSNRVEYWIRNYNPEKMLSVKEEKDVILYQSLNEDMKNWLVDLCLIIKESKGLSSDELMKKIYDICHHENQKTKRANQKLLFKIVYQLTLNNTNGPRIPLLIDILGIEKLLSLLDFK